MIMILYSDFITKSAQHPLVSAHNFSLLIPASPALKLLNPNYKMDAGVDYLAKVRERIDFAVFVDFTDFSMFLNEIVIFRLISVVD